MILVPDTARVHFQTGILDLLRTASQVCAKSSPCPCLTAGPSSLRKVSTFQLSFSFPVSAAHGLTSSFALGDVALSPGPLQRKQPGEAVKAHRLQPQRHGAPTQRTHQVCRVNSSHRVLQIKLTLDAVRNALRLSDDYQTMVLTASRSPVAAFSVHASARIGWP